MIIGIDFDGTCVSHEFPKVGKDVGAVPVLKRLVEAGHDLILYTMRSDIQKCKSVTDSTIKGISGNHLTTAVNWFKEHGIPLWGINENPQQANWTSSPKVYCHLYIDDTALGVPLIYPGLDKDGEPLRPYVDWITVEKLLEAEGVL